MIRVVLPCHTMQDTSYVSVQTGCLATKAHTEYTAYQAQVAADRGEGIRAKNLVVKSLKV